MKTTKLMLFILLFVCITNNLFSQGNNLQFSKVLLVNSLQTVPVDKVWKIEGAVVSSNLSTGIGCSPNVTNSNSTSFKINGVDAYVGAIQISTSCGTLPVTATTIGNLTQFPIWLPAGATLDKGTNVAYLSVIEYNVVPI